MASDKNYHKRGIEISAQHRILSARLRTPLRSLLSCNLLRSKRPENKRRTPHAIVFSHPSGCGPCLIGQTLYRPPPSTDHQTQVLKWHTTNFAWCSVSLRMHQPVSQPTRHQTAERAVISRISSSRSPRTVGETVERDLNIPYDPSVVARHVDVYPESRLELAMKDMHQLVPDLPDH